MLKRLESTMQNHIKVIQHEKCRIEITFLSSLAEVAKELHEAKAGLCVGEIVFLHRALLRFRGSHEDVTCKRAFVEMEIQRHRGRRRTVT